MKTATMDNVVIGDFNSPDFPYALPSDLPEDFSYPSDEKIALADQPLCDCFLCVAGEPCSHVRKVLLSRGLTPTTDWRLRD